MRAASLLSIFWLITPMHRLTFAILVIISILNGEKVQQAAVSIP